MTIFEMREKMAHLQSAINADAAFLTEKASDPTVSMDELQEKQNHMDDLQKRYDMLEKACRKAEEEARQRVQDQQKALSGDTEKDNIIAQKAAFYRDRLQGIVGKTYEGLGAIPAADADLGTGDKLLPTNLARELLIEPFEINPLRNVARITNITGYEEPKLGFTIEDADIADVTDKQTANEIAMAGDTVVYGRLKAKVMATIKDTVLHGTDLDVVTAVEGALRSALAKREKLFAFKSATAIYNSGTPDSVHRHMSFYDYTTYTSATNITYAIKTVEGETLYDAIAACLGDLADDFAANAKVMMKKSDYFGIIKVLSNNSEALFGSKPASILGHEVIFCDKADIPVVGDFNYYGINYDIGTMFEADKDAKKGEYYWVLTAWGDQQIRLKSAFRLALVGE
jgi:HK97 family phage major capsid protein